MTGLYDPIGSATTAISIAETNAVNTIVAGAPSTMNTLNKIATALNNDSSFYDTIISMLAEKLNITTAFSLLPPIGTIVSYGGSSAPDKWLFCQGQSLSTTTYSALFTAIGYTYGGSGATFNLPDCRGRTLIAPDGGIGRVTANNLLGNSAGSQEIPAHNHFGFFNTEVAFSADADLAPFGADLASRTIVSKNTFGLSYELAGATTLTANTGKSSTTGSGTNNLQPYLVVNYIIFANV
jgi:microcystin-dependent protein